MSGHPLQRLDTFDNRHFDRGGSVWKELAWLVTRKALFDSSVMPWNKARIAALRAMGGRIGRGVVIKPGVKVTFPWRLSVGNNSWLGEDAWLLDLAPIEIADHVCISQRAFLCTGSHDWKRPSFDLITQPIVIESGVWICASAFIGPGVVVGRDSVVKAGSVVTRDLPRGMICGGNPCRPLRPRTATDEPTSSESGAS